MDDSGALGLLAVVAIVAVVGVAAVAATGLALYAGDYALKADVQATACRGPAVPDLQNIVSVRTRAFGIEHDVAGLPDQQCVMISKGDTVEYRVRTKQTTIYRGGECVYDSASGAGCGQGVAALL